MNLPQHSGHLNHKTGPHIPVVIDAEHNHLMFCCITSIRITNEHKIVCQAAEAKAETKAIEVAKKGFAMAISKLESGATADVTLATKWFGTKSSTDAQAVKKNYNITGSGLSITGSGLTFYIDIKIVYKINHFESKVY